MGSLLSELQKALHEGGIPAYLTLGMGVISLVVIIDRAKALFFTYSMNTKEFTKTMKALVQGDKIEEAITQCANKEHIPLVHVVKRVLERADRDDESISKGQEIAIAEVMPVVSRRLGYLSMIANVATLLGLLGTIQGLIMAFAAVGNADPTQKQMILSQGISMAMYMTALGLMVAIPTMVAYSFLFARQNKHLEDIIESSSKVVDWLSTRHYQPFSASNVYPEGVTPIKNGGKTTPPPPNRNRVA